MQLKPVILVVFRHCQGSGESEFKIDFCSVLVRIVIRYHVVVCQNIVQCSLAAVQLLQSSKLAVYSQEVEVCHN